MNTVRTLFGHLWEHYLYQIPLRRKLLYAIMATLFLLVGVFSLFTIYYFSSFAEEQLLNSATETFDQTVIALNHTFLTYDKTTLGLARGDTFDRLMGTDLSHYTTEQLVPVRQSLEKAIFAAIPDHTEAFSSPHWRDSPFLRSRSRVSTSSQRIWSLKSVSRPTTGPVST